MADQRRSSDSHLSERLLAFSSSSIDASNLFRRSRKKKTISRTLGFRHRLIDATYYRGVVTNLTTVDRVFKYSVKTR